MEYRRGDGAATSAPLLQAGGNGHLTEMHHSSHPLPRRKPGLFAFQEITGCKVLRGDSALVVQSQQVGQLTRRCEAATG
jgi:hypothetical protein